jgi:hypothetical protein
LDLVRIIWQTDSSLKIPLKFGGRKLKLYYGFALCVALLVVSGCASQRSAVLDESQQEYQGAFSFINQDSVNLVQVQGTALFHMSPSFQLGPKVSYTGIHSPDVTLDTIGVGVEARVNLKTEGDFLPFIGGSLTLEMVGVDGIDDDPLTGFGYDIHAGIRVPVSPGAFIVTKLQFSAVSIDDVDTDNIGVFAGFAVRY